MSLICSKIHSDLGEITAEKQDRSRTRQGAVKGQAGLGTGAGNGMDPLSGALMQKDAGDAGEGDLEKGGITKEKHR